MRAAIWGGVARGRSNNTSNSTNINPDSNHSNLNATPSPLSRRSPLQSRDPNGIMRAPGNKAPLTPKSGNAMPSYDKQNASRPLMPTLSATAMAKTSNRTPLTPRVAASSAPTIQTPTSRRVAPRATENHTPGAGLEALLNNNITPRSGSRRSRVDSTNTIPNGTPTPASPEPFRIANDAPTYGSGLGISGAEKNVAKRPTVSFGPAISDLAYTKSPAENSPADAKFFFANEAKSTPPPRPTLPSKNSSFFYANGDAIPQPIEKSGTSAVGSIAGEDRPQTRFFHANGTPDLSASPSVHFSPPKPSSVVSSTSHVTSPRLQAASPGPFLPQQRPLSPTKVGQQPAVSSLRNTPSMPFPVLPRPQTGGRGQSANSIVANRRSSIEIVQRGAHVRSSSAGSNQDIKAPPVRKISGGNSTELQAIASPLNIVATSVPVSTPEETTGEEAKEISSGLQSPIKTGHSLEHMNELAANARRERKVLDLEITNSSLAAINRTLEREMRKQTAELRRYRRLSRSGRLSIATSASRTSTGPVSMLSDMVEGSVDFSDVSDEEESEDDDMVSDSEEYSDDASLSPSAMAESDLRHRKRDEKRLQLDLSKHQQLLIDSQRMNQSLKRCQAITEELINEGKKALEYHVRVSDVELGGRVLAPDEVEHGEEVENTEGMSDIGFGIFQKARKAAQNGVNAVASVATWGGGGRDDRDSGIELDASGTGSRQEQHQDPPDAFETR